MNYLLSKTKRIIGNESGNTFLENGFWIILVVFVLAIAAGALAVVVAGKFDDLKTAVSGVSVPSIP